MVNGERLEYSDEHCCTGDGEELTLREDMDNENTFLFS